MQWALAYLAGAWVLLQVFAALHDGLNWPESAFAAFLAAVALGFVLTLVVAWYHGEKGRQRVSGAELVIIAGLLSVAGILVRRDLHEDRRIGPDSGAVESTDTSDPELQAPRIAVLPFRNVSGNPEDLPLVLGIHEEVRDMLARVPALDVKSSTSVRPYEDSPQSLTRVASDLGVDYLVEGGVQRAGETLRIGAELYRIEDGEHQLWSEDWDRTWSVADILDIQVEIALQIATTLGGEVRPSVRSRLEVDPPATLRAYELYLEGLFHSSQASLGARDRVRELRDAVRIFEEVIEEDPEWAPGYAGLGEALHWLASGGVAPEVHYPRSRAMLEEALRYDPLYGPAWTGLGFVHSRWEPDLTEAERAYRRADALGERVHHGLALLLMSLGRFDEALREFDRAVQYDPLDVVGRTNRAWAVWCAGRYSRAVEELTSARAASEAYHSFIDFHLAQSYFRGDQRTEGLNVLRRYRDGEWTSPGRLALLYALADSVEVAQAYLDTASEEGEPRELAGAAAALRLGRRDRALELLRPGADEPLPMGDLSSLFCYDFSSIEGEPEFRALLRAAGVPEESRQGA